MTTPLTTGWEPGTEPGDTLLRRFVLAWAESLAAPVAAVGGRVTRTDDAVITDPGRPGSFYSSAVLLRPPPPEGWHTVLDEVEATLLHTGSGAVHLWSAWPTPDLSGRGWRLEGHPPFLLRPPGGTLPTAAADLRVEEVTTGDGLHTWERLVVEAYPMTELLPWRPGVLLPDEAIGSGLRAWVGHAAGRPVAAAASYAAFGLHVLTMGVVEPDARGHGYWRTMLRTRLEAFGSMPSASLFSDLSRPGAEGHGFWPISRFTLWSHDRPGR